MTVGDVTSMDIVFLSIRTLIHQGFSNGERLQVLCTRILNSHTPINKKNNDRTTK